VSLAWGCRVAWLTSKMNIINVHLDQAHLSANTPVNAKSSGFATGGGECASRTSYSRQYLNGVSFGFGDISFKLPGSNTKWANIGALLVGANSWRR
jgi:hypothetical protein